MWLSTTAASAHKEKPMKAHLIESERPTEIAQRDQICPLQGTRHDTGEPIWLVQSRSDPSCYYLLTVSGDKISCACPHAQHYGICAHAAAVRLAFQAQQPHATPTTSTHH